MEKQLIENIIKQLNAETLEELEQELDTVRRGGANCGISGFIYSRELEKFYLDNKKDILKEHKNLASDLGEDLLGMISRFNCLKDYKDLNTNIIGQFIYGDGSEAEELGLKTILTDAFCWSVLELLAFNYDGREEELQEFFN